jgi:hypothetical protein
MADPEGALKVAKAELNAKLLQLIAVCAAGGLGLLHVYTDGFVIRHLWNWFIVSSLDVPRLTQISAMGIDLLVSLMITPLFTVLHEVRDAVRDHKMSGGELFVKAVKAHMLSLIIWTMGYLLHLFL